MPISLFKCKHCKRIFNKKQDAIECENRHLEIKFARVTEYMKYNSYPLFIEITFVNGEKEIYMREKDAWFR